MFFIYIYIYAFSRRFYPKRLTLHSSYSFYIFVLSAPSFSACGCFNSNEEVYENACDLPPAAETVVTVTRAVEEESRDVFNSNGEVYENACDLPPAAETVVQCHGL